MLLNASQHSLSPETFGDDLKMFCKTGSTSSGYCSSPQDEASDESFDGDKVDYFSSSYKMWGDNNTNSEHIAHNILSQLFEEEGKSSLANVMSGDSGIVWSNDYPSTFSESLSSPLSTFSDETSDSAFMQWGSKQQQHHHHQLAPGTHPNGSYHQGGWPSSLQQNTPSLATNALLSQSGYNHSPTASSPYHHHHHHQQFNNNNQVPGFNNHHPNMTNSFNSPASFNNPNLGSFNNHNFNSTGNLGNFGGAGRMMNGMNGAGNYMVQQQQSRALPAEVLQQSIMRRKLAEQQNMLNFSDNRCYTPSNKLYPSNIISLSHHKKVPMSFNQFEYPIPQQPQISPDSKILLTTIESCWSQLLQLNREQKKAEYEVSVLFTDFVKPIPQPPKHKSHFKLDLLIQNTESTHALILAFIDNAEKASKIVIKMKPLIVKYVATLDEICREMLELKRQIHPIHGLCNDETIRKFIQTLELYSKHTKVVRSNLFMMVTMLRKSKVSA